MSQVSGAEGTTEAGTSYRVFHSIPYAEPPIEQLRLRDPYPKVKLPVVPIEHTKYYFCTILHSRHHGQMFVMPPPLDQRVSSPTWQEVSSVPRTASHSPSTPQNNLAGRPFLSWCGFLGEALSSVAPAKRIGTRSSSSTRFELSIIRPFELLDYLAGGCLCSGAIPARFPGIFCAAWKSFNRWQLWSQGPAGGTSVAAG